MLNKRDREHLNMLIKNGHYNKFMQNAFNKYQEFNFRVIIEIEATREELNELEIKTIQEYRDKYGKENIMNLTDGGDGGRGHIKSPLQIELARKFMTEHNPSRKIKRDQVLEIYQMIKDGKTNQEIADKFSLSSGYISCVRIGDKYPDLYKEHFREPVISPGRLKFTYEQFVDIVERHKAGENNGSIAESYSVDRSVISRLTTGKTYNTYWDIYNQ